MKRKELEQMQIQELYEIARKNGVRHDDSMSRQELIDQITGYEEESDSRPPEKNKFAAKNPDSAPKGEENTIEED